MHPSVESSAIYNSQDAELMQAPSTDKRGETVRCAHAGEYHSAVIKNERLPFATTWMVLEGITLSEISQAEKSDSIWFHSYVKPRKQTTKQNKRRNKKHPPDAGNRLGKGRGRGEQAKGCPVW